jgi:hypothetical protein
MALFRPGKGTDQAEKTKPDEPTEKLGDASAAANPGGPAPVTKPGAAAAPGLTPATPVGTRPGTPGTAAARPSERELVERLDGMRGWVGDLDHTVNVRSRIGLVLAAIAIGVGGAAIYLALDAKQQSASNSDVGSLRDQVSSLKDDVDSTSNDTTALKSSVNAARSQASNANATASALQAKIRKLQADVKDLQQSASNAATVPQTLPGVPTTGTGTTTTPSGGGSGGTGGGGNNTP